MALLRNRPAVGFERIGPRVVAVETPTGKVACGTIVVAAGPWTGRLLAGLGLEVPTPPVKGQMVLLRSDRPVLRRIVEHGDRYLVPRDDGHVLVGATEEDAGFDTRTTDEAVRSLIDEAVTLCPALASCSFDRAWAGLRPGSVDSRPYLGPAPGFENLYVASGHKRAGLQLSTGTALLLADLVRGRPPRIALEAFAPGREAGAPGDESFRSWTGERGRRPNCRDHLPFIRIQGPTGRSEIWFETSVSWSDRSRTHLTEKRYRSSYRASAPCPRPAWIRGQGA